MGRYYILSESAGAKVVEAAGVIDSHPFLVSFVGRDGSQEFERGDLVWWADAEAQVPWPFENLGRRHGGGERGTSGAGGAFEMMRGMQREQMAHADRSRKSGAAFGALLRGVMSVMPQAWKEGMLDVQVSFEFPPGKYRLAHRLRNLSTGAEVMDFSDELFVAIEVFHRVEMDLGEHWNECALTVKLDGKGGCEARMERRGGTNFARR